jgi:hypothetical protein
MGVTSNPQTSCYTHSSVRDRWFHRADDLFVPRCTHVCDQYGVWSESAGGFIYVSDCATDCANEAADILDELVVDGDTDTLSIRLLCADHAEQPYDGCQECAEEETEEDDEISTEADEDAVAEACDPEAVYAATVEGVRSSAAWIKAEAEELEAHGPGPFEFRSTSGHVMTFGVDSAFHPLRRALILRAEASVLENWTASQEKEYQEHVHVSAQETGCFNAVSRHAWALSR